MFKMAHVRRQWKMSKALVEKKVFRTVGGKNFVVVLVMIKTFLLYFLFTKDGNDPMELLKGE
jgi:hypothetical protein